jgi:hypothetical protein
MGLKWRLASRKFDTVENNDAVGNEKAWFGGSITEDYAVF